MPDKVYLRGAKFFDVFELEIFFPTASSMLLIIGGVSPERTGFLRRTNPVVINNKK